jgi:hypothetical protein
MLQRKKHWKKEVDSMKAIGKLGFILLGVWLIAQAIIPWLNFSFTGMEYVLGGVAIAAGVCFIIGKN